MHDILGGSNPTARPITGLLGNIYSGQIPFATPLGFQPPKDGVAIPNANGAMPTFNINGVPLGTGLAGTTFAGGNNNNNNGQTLNTQLGPDGLGLGFGTITVIDDYMTLSPELGTQILGKAQGVYVASSADGSTQMMAFTAMFEGGEYGDSLNFFGVFRIGSTMSRISVTGGTGKFKNACGFAEIRSLIPAGQHVTDVYHPRNQYLLHLDRKASQYERDNLAIYVQSVPLFKAAQNVDFIGKADFVYPIGASALSATLHGASILLKVSAHWDWFINLNAADYPLVTQDDLLHILSYMPKDLNFVNHTSYIGRRESRKLKPIVVDPGLYLAEEDEVFYATQKRELPDAYKLFSGSSSAILSRKFIEFCILGTDNLPRTLLMYLANSPSSTSVYFPTILCNSRKFNRTTINHNMQYASFNSRQEARPLNSDDFNDLVMSGAAFASPFEANDLILDQIDHELLHHKHNKPVPGGWCLGDNETEKCTHWGDAEVLRPGPGSKRLEKSFVQIFTNGTFRSSRCVYE
ncbi:hypothetical protein K7X08_010726 [Anisodus acutangulus]|uniref:Dirigent protein n=1 Tax=Anisodus acutangulus TaxID=402998 RepID=A0A9Q1LZE2_9SOLA|nr:hypothetical protein K7X08_010726 [Anisodus acutangulus]